MFLQTKNAGFELLAPFAKQTLVNCVSQIYEDFFIKKQIYEVSKKYW